MKVEKLDHIHLYVKDAESVARLFSKLFDNKWVGPVYPNDIKPNSVKLLYDNLGIELMQPLSPDHPVAKMIEKRGNMIGDIVLKVPNLDEAIAELESKGVRVLFRSGVGHMKYAMLHPKDTMGIMFELEEYQERLLITLAMLGRLENLPSPF